ncbi:MAG: hypothetical protein MHPSP_000186 [Paramarteilia canceri]
MEEVLETMDLLYLSPENQMKMMMADRGFNDVNDDIASLTDFINGDFEFNREKYFEKADATNTVFEPRWYSLDNIGWQIVFTILKFGDVDYLYLFPTGGTIIIFWFLLVACIFCIRSPWKAGSGGICCSFQKVGDFTQQLREGFLKLTKFQARFDEDKYQQFLVENYDLMDKNNELKFLQEVKKNEKCHNCCNSFLCLALTYTCALGFVIFLLNATIYGDLNRMVSKIITSWVNYTIHQIDQYEQNSLDAASLGFYSRIKHFYNKFSSIKLQRRAHLLSNKRIYIKNLIDIPKTAEDLVNDNLNQLHKTSTEFCNLDFLSDILYVEKEMKYQNEILYPQEVSVVNRFFEITDLDVLNDMSKTLETIKKALPTSDEAMKSLMDKNRKKTIRDGKPLQKPKIAKAKEFLRKSSFSSLDFIEARQTIRKFTNSYIENALQFKQSYQNYCERESERIFITPDILTQQIENILYGIKDSLTPILELLTEKIDYPDITVNNTIITVTRQLSKIMEYAAAPLLLSITYALIILFFMIFFYLMRAILAKFFNTTVLELYLNMGQNFLTCYQISIGMMVSSVVFVALVNLHKVYQEKFCLWEPLKDPIKLGLMPNDLTEQSIGDILGDYSLSLSEISFSQIRQRCSTIGILPENMGQFNLYDSYMNSPTSSRKYDRGDTRPKFNNKKAREAMEKVKELQAKDLFPKLTYARIYLIRELYKHLNNILEEEKKEASKMFSNSLEYAKVLPDMYKLLVWSKEISEVAAKIEDSRSKWNIFYNLIVYNEVDDDFMGFVEYAHYFGRYVAKIYSDALMEEIRKVTLHCETIIDEIDNLTYDIRTIFRSLFGIFYTMISVLIFLSIAGLLLMARVFIHRGIKTSNTLRVTEKVVDFTTLNNSTLKLHNEFWIGS